MRTSVNLRKRGILLGVVLLAMLSFPVSARAGHAVVVAVVADQPEAPTAEVLGGFREDFVKRGDTLELSTFPLSAENGATVALVEKIRAAHPQLILALGSRALTVVAREFPATPIVFGLVLRTQLLPPKKNITGVVLDFPVTVQLDWLHKLLPQAKNVGVIYHPGENAERIAQAQKTAQHLGLTLLARPIESPRQLPAALESLANNADVIWGLSDQMVINARTARNLLLFSFRNRIPFFGLSAAWVKAGALFALSRDYRSIGGQCAELARAILAGAKPASLSPQTPNAVFYSLNRRTAEQMKINLPAAVLRQAKEVF